MATRSFSTNVRIKDKHLGYTLLSALENAQNKKTEEVKITKKCKELKGEDIKKLFGDSK